MIPRLEAGEMLAAIRVDQLAQPVSGSDEIEAQAALEERQQQLDALRSKAAGEAPPPPPAPVKADPSDLAGMGIGIANAGDLPAIDNLEEWLGNV
jgi:hypothetical protein